MKLKFPLLSLFCIIGITVRAQKDTSIKFNLGDPAPPLRVKEWIKGTPVQSFEKGKVYVVDFWATWCGPCRASMPHLSGLARKYKRKITFLAIDVYESRETKTTSITQLKAFVDSMGRRMNFRVAVEDTNYTVHDWLKAYHVESIPTSFVVDGQGRVAWMGFPTNLDTVLQKILDNTWDIKAVLSKSIFDDNWEKSDMEVIEKANRYQGNPDHLDDLGYFDSTLMVVNEMVKKRPDLKYAPWAASYTFSALLIKDPHKAYEFGKQEMATSTYGRPAWNMIIDDIRGESRKINLSPEIYRLGATCYQAEIDHIIYPQLYDMAKKYREMAAWYRLAGDKPNALKADKKALKFYRKKSFWP